VDKLVIASNNKGKVTEIKQILAPFFPHIYSLKDLGMKVEIVEDGQTFEENAIKKARTVMELCGYPVLADDSGLEVDALNGQPGVYSARFAGEHANDDENNRKLLRLLEGIPYEKRKARFRCSTALCFPGRQPKIILSQGSCHGIIGFAPKGSGGFGYDPLFIVPEYGLTFAELSPEIKNQISHRSKALLELKEKLRM